MTKIDIGIGLPTIGDIEPLDAVGGVGAAARHIEGLGFESVWAPDLIIGDGTPSLEAIVALAVAAGATERVRLGSSVLVLAQRPVAWVGAQIGTLQHLSGDRVILGVGVGGFPGTPFWEFAGAPTKGRGSFTDAALEVLPSLIAGRTAEAQQRPPVTLAPASAVPPVLIGGNSDAAIRRAAAHGDAWFPSLIPPSAVAEGAARLRREAADGSRTTPGITVGGHVMPGTGAAARSARDALKRSLLNDHGMSAQDAEQIPITGNVAELAERFSAYAEAGAERLVLSVDGGDWRKQSELVAEAHAMLG